MEQTFVRTIQAHQVEFNRLLYPTRYKVIVRIDNENPITCSIDKAEDDWNISIEKDCPGWLHALRQHVIDAVKTNEAS